MKRSTRTVSTVREETGRVLARSVVPTEAAHFATIVRSVATALTTGNRCSVTRCV
jgi:hypothetical protein